MNKNIIIVILVGLLLIGAVYLNIKTQSGLQDSPSDNTESGDMQAAAEEDATVVEEEPSDYFEAFREERDQVRDKEIEYLDDIIAASASDDETLAQAQQQKLSLVDNMEKEFIIESMLKAKGFDDVAVTFQNGSVNIVISADELSAEQAAQVFDVVIRETGEKADNIKVITNKG